MRALARALELGVDFWDTANVYGEGLRETLIGKFLAEDRGRRARVTLATKFAIRRQPDGSRVFDNSSAQPTLSALLSRWRVFAASSPPTPAFFTSAAIPLSRASSSLRRAG